MLLLDAAAQAATIGVMGPAATALADAFWPGGLTLVVPRRPDVPLPAALTGGAPTIGLRVPDHDAPRALAAASGRCRRPRPTSPAPGGARCGREHNGYVMCPVASARLVLLPVRALRGARRTRLPDADRQPRRRAGIQGRVATPRRGVGERTAGQLVARAREHHDGDLIAASANAGTLGEIGSHKAREALERFGDGLRHARAELDAGRSLGHVAIAAATLPGGLVAHYQRRIQECADARQRRDAGGCSRTCGQCAALSRPTRSARTSPP